MNRAYSVLTVKSMDEEKRQITGIATTPTPDRVGDIVEPKGAEFQLPIPLLWQHDSRQPIGHVTEARVTEAGIEVTATLVKIDEPGTLKDRLDTAWQSIKSGLVRGFSIGFKELEYARIGDSYSYRYLKWMWLELSAVTIPANGDCSITAIKSADDALRRAASGHSANGVVSIKAGPPSASPPPGVSGTENQPAQRGLFYVPKGTDMNIAEQLAAFDLKRKSALERMDAIMTKCGEEGRTLDERETEEYDGLQAEAKTIDQHIARLKAHEAIQISKATPVPPAVGTDGRVATAPGNIISVHRNLPKGTAFTRFAMSLAASKGNLTVAERIAETKWKDTPEVALVLKAATQEGTTSDSTWAGPLVQYQDMASEFIELLRAETILGRLTALRRVPFNVRMSRQTSGTTGTFVGEGLPTPVKELAFDSVTLQWAKCSTICVISAELARFSDPMAEARVRQDLIEGIAEYLDKRLIDPAYPGVSGVSPASLTNGVTPTQASGATIAALDANWRTIMASFATTNQKLQNLVVIMSPSQAIRFSMMRTSQDLPLFPNMGMNGGSMYGLPVITSNNVTPSGSPGDEQIIFIDQGEVLLADDGQIMLDVSSEASLEFNDAPSGGATSLRSLWQNGLIGVKAERWINWTKRRSTAVKFIDKAQSYAS